MCPQKNRTWEPGLFSHERPILQKTQTSILTVTIHQESLPIPKPMNLPLGLWPDISLHSLPTHTACPKPSMDSLVACYMCFLNCSFSAIPE